MFRRMMVPLDGSEFSKTALPYALALGSGAETTIELVSALDSAAVLNQAGYAGADFSVAAPGFAGSGGAPAAAGDLLESVRSGRERDLRATAEDIRSRSGAVVEWRVVDGEPSEVVAALVEASGADLVVMATHGRGGLERAWLGSVADRLVRRVTVPLLLVRPDEDEDVAGSLQAPPAVGRVLVPLDGSPLAESVLEPATRVARLLGAAIVLARITGEGLSIRSPYLPHAAEEEQEHVSERRRDAQEYLDGVAERLRGDGLEVAVEVREGNPPATILELARETGGMVAMATHGRSGLRRWMLGSVSDKVLRGSELPVLLVRPADEGED